MTTFQFDQCFNDKKVIKACNEEGLAIAHRLPRDLQGKEDPELLAILMQRPNPLVTLDRALPAQHTAHIPDFHPGIIVVNYSRDVVKTITTGEAAKILNKFKERIKTWHQLSVQNSVMEITEKSIEIWHVENGKLTPDDYLEFADDENWIEQLLKLLQQNSQKPTAQSNILPETPSGEPDPPSA